MILLFIIEWCVGIVFATVAILFAEIIAASVWTTVGR